ncbi:MAG: secretion protein, partial [Coprobacter sp.]|nr:secretion protein [Coprobacter sp.]
GVPYGSVINANWKTALENIGNLSAEKVGKFLYYHGQDGLGYNSEWGSYAPTKLITLHNGLKNYMADKNPIWEVLWYGGTNDLGNIAFDRGLDNNQKLFEGASIFMNYNWESYMESAISKAKSWNQNPFLCYAGMNVQGGEPKSGVNYTVLKNYQYSIGLWGAHAVNMYWQDRYKNGSSPETKISTYLTEIEEWFTNGQRNPAVKMPIKDSRVHRPFDDWAGISSMMSARSTLKWDLTKEPFVTYFNVGNGTFFNFRGERMHNNQWYNIGVQDYLPTWRYWFAPKFLGGQESAGIDKSSVHLNASVTWEDAYFGGSCLKISGTTEDEWLHLFKTDFNVQNGSRIRVWYKLLGGEADISLELGKKTTGAVPTVGKTTPILTVDGSSDAEDKSFIEGWQEALVTLAPKDVLSSGLNANISVVALRFQHAKNLELLIGGLEILPPAATTFAAPLAPEITNFKVFTWNNSGVDAKIIWNMSSMKTTGEPVYNLDVNTSLFRMWAQQEGEKEQMLGMTTSWAGLIYAAQVNPQGIKNMRFGVSALSLDMQQESAITWTAYQQLPDYTTIDDIQINKNIIKPDEPFELSYVDPLHDEATWTITGTTGTQVYWTGEGRTAVCETGLPDVGPYNLKVECNGQTKEYPSYVAISSEDVGALPEIHTLKVEGSEVQPTDEAIEIDINQTKNFSYTGRSADGSSSRGIDLNERWFGVQCGELNLKQNQSFSVAAWIKYDELPAGRSNFITVEDRINGGWPMDNWGYFWSRINEEGKFLADIIDTAWGFRTQNTADGDRIFYRFDGAKIDVGAWTHVAVVFEYENATSNKMRCHFYINGKKQIVSCYLNVNKGALEGKVGSENGEWTNLEAGKDIALNGVYGENTTEPLYAPHGYPVTSGMWIAFGGSTQNVSAVKGCVDDFQVWGKAMSDEDVQNSMLGLDAKNLPPDVLGYWSFETDPTGTNNGFVGAVGTNATNKNPNAYWYKYDTERVNNRDQTVRTFDIPPFMAGSPFIQGEAYRIETKPTWNTRRATVDGDGTGVEGSANITWSKPGDYSVELKLENGHGAAVMNYPVVKISDPTGVETAEADGFITYTVEDALIVDFGADGNYTVDVYNTAGMLAAQKAVSVVAGQTALIRLGQPGVYIVKVCRDGQVLRTVKVLRK